MGSKRKRQRDALRLRVVELLDENAQLRQLLAAMRVTRHVERSANAAALAQARQQAVLRSEDDQALAEEVKRLRALLHRRRREGPLDRLRREINEVLEQGADESPADEGQVGKGKL